MVDQETYLITGGTGSMGTAITKELLKCNPRSIRLYSRNEYFQWKMLKEIPDQRLRFLIGDIRDYGRLYRAMQGVDTVIHTAALKHVDLCEYNPIEAVRTNVEGSVNVIKEFRNYRWKQDKDGKSLNIPIDIFNHSIDASRYAITYLLGSQNKFIKPKIHIPK